MSPVFAVTGILIQKCPVVKGNEKFSTFLFGIGGKGAGFGGERGSSSCKREKLSTNFSETGEMAHRASPWTIS